MIIPTFILFLQSPRALDLSALALRIKDCTSVLQFLSDARFMLQARLRHATASQDAALQRAYTSASDELDERARGCSPPTPQPHSTVTNTVSVPLSEAAHPEKSSVLPPFDATRVVVRLRRMPRHVNQPSDESQQVWLAVLPTGQVAPGSQGYSLGGKHGRDAFTPTAMGATVVHGRGKKGPAVPSGGLSALFEPGSPQYAFWKGVVLVWDMMGIPTAGV
jgi:hypothetical protein